MKNRGRPLQNPCFESIEKKGFFNALILRIFAMTGVVLFLSGAVFAEDFSANMISTTKEGTYQGKVFVTKDKMRIEMMGSITISRADRRVVWMLMPEDKTYMEMSLKPQDIVMTGDKTPDEISRRLVGRETIDQKMTDKYEIEYAVKGNNSSVFVWLIKNLNLPVKSSATDGSWSVEYKNIVVAKQPASLFEIPAGYKKFSAELPGLGELEY
jgi:hypothetical protein